MDKKFIYEIKFLETEVFNETTGVSSSRTDLNVEIIGKLNALTMGKITAFYLMEGFKYGITINIDGIIEYFEYEKDEPEWQHRIGNPENGMEYRRTKRFYNNP